MFFLYFMRWFFWVFFCICVISLAPVPSGVQKFFETASNLSFSFKRWLCFWFHICFFGQKNIWIKFLYLHCIFLLSVIRDREKTGLCPPLFPQGDATLLWYSSHSKFPSSYQKELSWFPEELCDTAFACSLFDTVSNVSLHF